jgi:hypothetical protein
LTIKIVKRIFLSVNAIYAFANNQQPKREGQMSNTYQAGLKFERINAGVYRVINIKGRIIANINRYIGLTGTYWDLIVVGAGWVRSYEHLSNAKDCISDPAYKDLHLAES